MVVRPVTAPAAWGCSVHDWRDSAYRSDFVAEGKIGCGIEPMGAVISALIARSSYSTAMAMSRSVDCRIGRIGSGCQHIGGQ
jgi:hypothetical protein